MSSSDYNGHELAASAAILISGLLMAAIGDSNHEMCGGIAGSAYALISYAPEIGYVGLVCAVVGEMYLNYNESSYS